MDTIKVVCGIIVKDERILICRRKSDKSLGGYWEFPGGKVESKEDYQDSLTRELQEELGMSVEITKHFKTVIHSYEKFTIELISFMCDFNTASFKMTDHDLYEWVYPNNLLSRKLAPADIPIATSIVANYNNWKNIHNIT